MKFKTEYVEIKCQLDATDDFYCRSYCLINMLRAPLCPSSGAPEYYTSGCCLSLIKATARKPETQTSAPHHTDNLKTKAPNTTGSNQNINSGAPDDGHNGARNMLSKQ